MNWQPSKILVLVLIVLGTFATADREYARAQTPPVKAVATTLTFRVEGMACAACSIAVRTALKRLDGVKRAEVTGDQAVVEYDPVKLTPQALADTVEKLGYHAVLPPSPR